MKSLLIIILCVFFCVCANTQNLVPNYSFEDTISCPSSQGQINNAYPWFNPTANSPDYYNSCWQTNGNANVDVPSNFLGHQNARTGNAYAGLGPYYLMANGREYIETSLMDSLIGGKKYCVQFYVSLSDTCRFAIDVVGAYLSIDSITSNTLINLPYAPQVENTYGNVISDKENWTLISGEYIAQGGERFITIGNFRTDANTTIDTVVPDSTPGMWYYEAYYYIDDVSVYYCGCDTVAPMAKFNYTTDTLTATFNNLSSSFADNWQWYFGDGITDTANSPVHTYDSAGVYDVTFVACYGFCCDTMVASVAVNDVGIGEFQNENHRLQIYPNPAGNRVGFVNNFTGKINLYNLLGQKIYSFQFEKELDISFLPPGMYIVEADDKQGIARTKLLKQ